MVASKSKSPANDFTNAEPSVQLDAKHWCDSSILNLQIASVFPQELHAIKLLPEWVVAARKAENDSFPQVNITEILMRTYSQCICSYEKMSQNANLPVYKV
jgi:hypothetical protein